jgi:hypothetical protein
LSLVEIEVGCRKPQPADPKRRYWRPSWEDIAYVSR